MKKTYNIQTFGCQMNERDSERLCGFLNDAGFNMASEEEANLIIINTCTVRENANNKLYGHLGYLKSQKERNKDLKIAICGCMMQEEGMPEKIKKSYPFVDLIFGTQNIEKFPELLEGIMQDEKIFDTEYFDAPDPEMINTNHKFPFKSGVNIMFGCNNFCSYCIVPYVRGREKSRTPNAILKEIKLLAEDGVSEVMLLGQNVNSYGKTLENPISFSELLKMVEKIDGIERIRFMTSHPKDLSDELIDTIASSKKICKHIHLPLQSGSSRILKEMNRKYDKEAYLTLCKKLRERMPDIAITTDIIVGFPGETEEDFLETMDVAEKVIFDSAFTFVYSRRTGTPAASLPQNATEEEIKDRFDRLLNLIHKTGKERLDRLVGTTETILIERENEKDPSLVTGRCDKNFLVHIPGDKSMIGKYIPVRLTESKGFYFNGEVIN